MFEYRDISYTKAEVSFTASKYDNYYNPNWLSEHFDISDFSEYYQNTKSSTNNSLKKLFSIIAVSFIVIIGIILVLSSIK